MRILYSVQGDGKGHAVRSSVIIAWLRKKGHSVLIAASNDAYPILAKKFSHVIKIEGARMVFDKDSLLMGKTVSDFFTGFFKRTAINFGTFYPIFRRFKPQLVISDFEPMAYYFSKLFNAPLISIDNNSAILRCKQVHMPKGDENILRAAKLVLRLWSPGADYYIISTFIRQNSYSSKVIFVPPILRKQILEYKPKDKGHVLVYQTSDRSKHFLDILKKFDMKFIVYGFDAEKTDKNLVFKKFNEEIFFKDLGDASAVITNGGYTLMGEAVYLHKPVLSVPIKKQAEQIYNAVCLDKLKFGLYLKHFSYEGINRFFEGIETYKKHLGSYRQEGNNALFRHLEKLLGKYRHKK